MIKVLGASGGLDKNKGCSTFLLNNQTLIDAGHVMSVLGEDSIQIEHVFLTHAHFDHIADLPFLIETHFEKRTQPLKVYGLKTTLDAVKSHLFNDQIWPKFQDIPHPKTQQPMLLFIEIEWHETMHIGDLSITPIAANHAIAACGFLIKEKELGCLISGDTYLNPGLIEIINQDPSIQSLIVETSFPSHLSELALATKHLTPTTLKETIANLNRPIKIYPYHLKSNYEADILDEFNRPEFQSLISKVLEAGDEIDAFANNVHITRPHQHELSANEQQLKSMISIAQALSAETNLDRLFEMIIEQAMAFSNADAGTLYQISSDKKELLFSVIQNRSLNIKMGGTAEPIAWKNLPLYHENGGFNTEMVAALCAITKQVINIDDVYEATDFNFEGTKKFDQSTGYRSVSMLVVPLLDRHQKLLGVLQLINKLDRDDNPIPFREADLLNTLALGSQAAIALNNLLLIHELETLFESIIETITKAFDEKCSFTGNHVRQVSTLSMLLANAINEDQGTYKAVSYSSDELQTIKIAALLHDVGKISTPEFIMQKSTKLEKVYDRLETIRERIEILKRDAKIDYLEKQLDRATTDHSSSATFENHYHNQIQYLDTVFQYIERVNKGNDVVTDDDLAKIETFKDMVYERQGVSVPLLQADEAENLAIKIGTLNNAERAKIKDHARVSLEILQTLPFPKKYQRVIDIAANHHEKLDGSGYPRGLSAEELSLEDRILILADLYEALSSQDRPYKEPHTLSQIFEILSFMANEGLIDKTLLQFFFESGTYKQYNPYLQAQQLDDVPLQFK